MREPFTHRDYREILETARAAGYAFVGFDALRAEQPRPPEPFLLLRHDLDYAPRWAVPLARLEQELGVRSTYCFLANSKFYSMRSRETRASLAAVLECGHWLGLHYDASGEADDTRVVSEVERIASEWEAAWRVRIDGVSFHVPGHRRVGHLELPSGRVNAYAPRFFGEIDYVSDSNQSWRGRDVRALLRGAAAPRLQMLVHPIWWRERFVAFEAVMAEVAAEAGLSLDAVLTPEQRARAAAAP
jgi:hypothetical protein